MPRTKGAKNKPKEVQVYRNEDGNLVLAKQRFMQGQTPPESAEDKGNIRALLQGLAITVKQPCLLYTSDAADDLPRVDFGGRRIIKYTKLTLPTNTFY